MNKVLLVAALLVLAGCRPAIDCGSAKLGNQVLDIQDCLWSGHCPVSPRERQIEAAYRQRCLMRAAR